MSNVTVRTSSDPDVDLDAMHLTGRIAMLKAHAYSELEGLRGFAFEDRNPHCNPVVTQLDAPPGHRRHVTLSLTEESPVGRLRSRTFLAALNKTLEEYKAELKSILMSEDKDKLLSLIEIHDGR